MGHVTMRACAQAAYTSSTNGLFMVCYLLLCWNMMCRTENAATVIFQHLHWVNDCLAVDCFITKADQTASKSNQKHIYANPLDPLICPILALGMYLIERPEAEATHVQNFVFPATKSKKKKSSTSRFLTGLKKLVSTANTLLAMTIDCLKIGAHSLRKGAVTFAAGGSTMAPGIVSILLRAGWSLQGVENRYFKFEGAMDQFLGRVICGLPINSGNFAILPPFFCMKTAEDVAYISQGEFGNFCQCRVFDFDILQGLSNNDFCVWKDG